MTKLQEIVTMGFLKNGEEIYLEYKGQTYTGRILENGKKIKTKLGDHSSLSKAASISMQSNPNCMRKVSTKNGDVPNNGWEWWKTWNGTKLEEYRKKLND